jgi:hypothetical protein
MVDKMNKEQDKINIDGTEYLLSELSDEVKAQIQSLQFVDGEIARLKAKVAVASTARMAYMKELKALLAAKK